MNKAKEILDRHLMSKNTNTSHIHIVAYMACLDAVNEALSFHDIVVSVKNTDCLTCSNLSWFTNSNRIKVPFCNKTQMLISKLNSICKIYHKK